MIYMFCPDNQTPTGGVKVIYRHVDLLNASGVDAVVVHEEPGFRVEWFDNDTRVTSRSEVTLHSSGIAVLPEVYGPDASDYAPGMRKVIFNQSGSLTFHDYPQDGAPSRTPYLDPEVIACFGISERVVRYLEHTFPMMPVFRVSWSVDAELFRPAPARLRQIAFMPRKHPEEAREVFNILRYRGVLDGYAVVPLDGLTEAEVAAALSESLFFFSFGYPEGLPLPPAEAMAAGCVVIGYHGWGGEEFFDPGICHPVPNGDVLAFAKTAEEVILRAREDGESVRAQGDRAREYVISKYSREREAEALIAAWRCSLM